LSASPDHSTMRPARVRVYRNLLRAVWSVLDLRSGLVVGHEDTLVLVDVALLVRESTRQRVIQRRRRTVHAFAEGVVSAETVRDGGVKLHYDPFEAGHFTVAGVVVKSAARVDFRRDGAFVHV